MRVTTTIDLLVTEDAEGKMILFGPDEVSADIVCDGFVKITGPQVYKIDAAANEDINFGDIATCRHLYIRADGDFKMTFNGGAEQLTIKRLNSTSGAKSKFGADVEATALNIENTGSTTLTLVVVMIGEAAA